MKNKNKQFLKKTPPLKISYKQFLKKDIAIKDQLQAISEKDIAIKDQLQAISEKDIAIKEQIQLLNEKELDIDELSKILEEKDDTMINLNQIANAEETELTNLRHELSSVHDSILYNTLRNACNKVDKAFPNGTKRGDFRQIVVESFRMISKNGFSSYLADVKVKLRRKEFKVMTPTIMTEQEKVNLIDVVEKNRKNRLKIESHDENTLKKDEFVLTEDDEKLLKEFQ